MNAPELIPPQAIKPTRLLRYRVFTGPKAKTFLCVCAARHEWHALAIARQTFNLNREAFAIREGHPESWLC